MLSHEALFFSLSLKHFSINSLRTSCSLLVRPPVIISILILSISILPTPSRVMATGCSWLQIFPWTLSFPSSTPRSAQYAPALAHRAWIKTWRSWSQSLTYSYHWWWRWSGLSDNFFYSWKTKNVFWKILILIKPLPFYLVWILWWVKTKKYLDYHGHALSQYYIYGQWWSIYQTLSSADAGCHDWGPLLVRSPIPVGEALMMPTDFCLK